MTWTVHNTDCLAGLRELPDNSVQTCITSPPYWGLRDYGVEGQLGLEPTPEEYVAHLVEVFREVRRVLRPDGTLWLNLGDSYADGGRGGGGSFMRERRDNVWQARSGANGWRPAPSGLKHKDLVGVPWRVAFALQADGWYLRSDIIWQKPNPMPESVTDRPTKAHEYLFLLAKSERYYYDAEAIREEATTHLRDRRYGPGAPGRDRAEEPWNQQGPYKPHKGFKSLDTTGGRNRRTVWTIPTQPFPEAHFATFPPKLVEPCILAGSAPKACPKCGTPWKRQTKVTYNNPGNRSTNGPRSIERRHETAGFAVRLEKEVTTIGWEPTCTCEENDGSGRCLVLDPFAGAGTTLLVAERHGRDSIGFELNPEYCNITRRRLAAVQTQLL